MVKLYTSVNRTFPFLHLFSDTNSKEDKLAAKARAAVKNLRIIRATWAERKAQEQKLKLNK